MRAKPAWWGGHPGTKRKGILPLPPCSKKLPLQARKGAFTRSQTERQLRLGLPDLQLCQEQHCCSLTQSTVPLPQPHTLTKASTYCSSPASCPACSCSRPLGAGGQVCPGSWKHSDFLQETGARSSRPPLQHSLESAPGGGLAVCLTLPFCFTVFNPICCSWDGPVNELCPKHVGQALLLLERSSLQQLRQWAQVASPRTDAPSAGP